MRTKLMLIVLNFVICLIFACGHSPKMAWYKPDATQSDFAKDKYVCMQESQQRRSVAVGGYCYGANCQPGVARSQVETNYELFNACMQARGWTLKEERPEYERQSPDANLSESKSPTIKTKRIIQKKVNWDDKIEKPNTEEEWVDCVKFCRDKCVYNLEKSNDCISEKCGLFAPKYTIPNVLE